MNRFPPEGLSSVRLNAGLYALTKLAAAGLTFLVFLLLLPVWPHEGRLLHGWPFSVPYAIYAYGLPAALVADALLRLLQLRPLSWALLVYGAAGGITGLWIAAGQSGHSPTYAAAGIILMLLLRLTQLPGERYPGLLPVFALLVPLLCLAFL